MAGLNKSFLIYVGGPHDGERRFIEEPLPAIGDTWLAVQPDFYEIPIIRDSKPVDVKIPDMRYDLYEVESLSINGRILRWQREASEQEARHLFPEGFGAADAGAARRTSDAA